MNLNAIETFLAIDETGSFHAAARRLNLTQTAVSARIRGLEETLGEALFERGAGGTRPSAAGRHFRPYAEQMLQIWRFAAADISGTGERRSSLRLGTQLSIWDSLLVDVAVWMEREGGRIPFTLNYDHVLNMTEAVRQRLLDIAIVNEVPQGTRLTVEELPPDRLVLVSDRKLSLGADDLPLFINLELGGEYARQLQQVIPVHSQQHIVLGNAQMGLRYLIARGGMGYFPLAMLQSELKAARLFEVSDAPVLPLACNAIYLPEHAENPQIRDVLRGLRHRRSETGR